MRWCGKLHSSRQLVVIIAYDAAKITKNTTNFMPKYRKKYLEMTAPKLFKAAFKIWNTLAE